MKTVLLLSGGLDSSVLAGVLRQNRTIHPLRIHYGQRHWYREGIAARRITKALGLEPIKTVDLNASLGFILRGSNSSLVNHNLNVPDGHYAHESMKITIVPNRNMVLLSVATMYAVTIGAEEVAYAAHAGDHATYPDCRPEFADAMRTSISLCDDTKPTLLTPFIRWTKADIARKGAELKVPMELTYSCYKGGAIHCGTCGTCTERKEAFQLAGVPDPTRYEK